MSRRARIGSILVLAVLVLLALSASASADGRHHIVRPGQTLLSIGRMYGVHYLTIARANGLVNPNLIFVGQRLHIPGAPPPYEPPNYEPSGTSWWKTWNTAQPEPSAVGPAGTCASWLRCLDGCGCSYATATAICRDGTCSCGYGASSCYWHGGVRCWVERLPLQPPPPVQPSWTGWAPAHTTWTAPQTMWQPQGYSPGPAHSSPGGHGYPAPDPAPPAQAQPQTITVVQQTTPPSYQTGPCNCTTNLYDCGDFLCEERAQDCYDYCWLVQGRDIHWLDDDGDGRACEALPTCGG